MKFAAILLIFFALAPAASAHHVYPAQGGLRILHFGESETLWVYPETGEQCFVTAEAVEQVISGTALLKISNSSSQPALKVTFEMSAARHAVGPTKTTSSGIPYLSESTVVYV